MKSKTLKELTSLDLSNAKNFKKQRLLVEDLVFEVNKAKKEVYTEYLSLLNEKNNYFEGVCIEDLHNNKLKMYVGPDYGYDTLTVAVLSKKDMEKLSANIFLNVDKYLATIEGDFQIKLKTNLVSIYFGKYKIYSLKDCVVFIEI